ncbi:MAG: Gfo/Idh/MocA family oxidoreductase [Planctomycetaceae bacterium]
MSHSNASRRDFLQVSTAAAAGAVMPYWFQSLPTMADDAAKSPNARLRLGCIGTGDRWHAVGPAAMNFADTIAVADVDASHVENGRKKGVEMNKKHGHAEGAVAVYEDYRKLLERDDIDVVTIVTPDHWHSKIAIDAMRAGKDIYCEKPLTLTINEGKQIVKVLDETKRVFQVGTQQRTEMGRRFIGAVAMIREGRIGKIQKVTCNIGGAPTCDAIPLADVPAGLNWEMWQGQAPLKDYRKRDGGKYGNSRCHYEFRWWYEYSGGKMTDWGAHHVDIASWAIGATDSGPSSVEGTAEHPVDFKDGYPVQDDRYNTAHKFDITVMYPSGIEMHIVSNSPEGNGILFEGTEGSFHVSRGDLKDVKGTAVADLKTNPITTEMMEAVYGKKLPGSHMENFFNCIADRSNPISDVWSHHRAMTTCHLSNIAIRLGRRLEWDAKKEQIVGDEAANHWLGREQRKGYEIDVPL